MENRSKSLSHCALVMHGLENRLAVLCHIDHKPQIHFDMFLWAFACLGMLIEIVGALKIRRDPYQTSSYFS